MASKKFILAYALILSLAISCIAQEQNEIQNKVVQPFSWKSGGDILYYEIVIEEKAQNGSYRQVFSHTTTEEETEACTIFITPPLKTGNYRSTIRMYNILGQREDSLTHTENFIVHKAYLPEISSVFNPLSMASTIYIDDNSGIIELKGKNLFSLKGNSEAYEYTEYRLENEKNTYFATGMTSHSEKNQDISLTFNINKLNVGEYHIVAKDRSGFESEKNDFSTITVKFKKRFDLDLSAGYACPIITNDATIPEYMGSKVWPLSGAARASFIFSKHRWGYLGLGLSLMYTRMNAEFDFYTLNGNLMQASLNAVYQLPVFGRRVVLDFHGGLGVTYFNNFVFHFSHGIESEPLNTLSPSLNGGMAVQFYVKKQLFTEAALDYVLTLNKDMTLGRLVPFIGLGWQF